MSIVKSIIKKFWSAGSANLVTFDAGAGRKRVYDVDQLPANIRAYLPAFAIMAKVGDKAAIKVDPVTGAPASVQTKFDAMDACWKTLMTGNWNEKREVMTAADKFAAMKETTILAWVSLDATGKRKASEFAAWLKGNIAKNVQAQVALGNAAFRMDEETAIRKLHDRPEIQSAIAKLRKPTDGVDVQFDDLEVDVPQA